MESADDYHRFASNEELLLVKEWRPAAVTNDSERDIILDFVLQDGTKRRALVTPDQFLFLESVAPER